MKKEDNVKNTEKNTRYQVFQMGSGDDSVLIDLGEICTEKEMNLSIDNAIKKIQKEMEQ